MNEDKIELHTVGIFRGEEYELQDLFNGLLEENRRLNNILEEFEEDLEREINIKEEDLKIEHNTYIDINSTLRKVLERFKELKGSDKE